MEQKMIDLELMEPLYKSCVYCGKTRHLKGILIHWPSEEDIDNEIVKLPDSTSLEPFSFWVYTCAWCRGILTKKATHREKNSKIGEQTMIRLPGQERSFRCSCGGNVFTKVGEDKEGKKYRCNSCGIWWRGY